MASWQRLADEGQYAQALVTLEATGGFDAALRDATADQLMSLVDVARATGQRQPVGVGEPDRHRRVQGIY